MAENQESAPGDRRTLLPCWVCGETPSVVIDERRPACPDHLHSQQSAPRGRDDVRTVLDAIPEMSWSAAVWIDSNWCSAKIDVADRRRLATEIVNAYVEHVLGPPIDHDQLRDVLLTKTHAGSIQPMKDPYEEARERRG